MKKTLTRSKTFDGDLTKLERRLPRQSTLPSFGNPAEFDYKRDTKHLCKILKHCVTAHILDFDFILHFLSSYNCEQRMILVHDLEYEYHYKLIDMVLERPESPMRSCTLAMLVEPVELYVRDFHELLTLKLTGKIDSDISRILVEILLGLTNDDARKFKETYESLFESSVKKDIEIVQGEKSIISKLLIQLLEGKRYAESGSSATIAKNIAKKLYEATEDTPAIDYDTFIRIFTRDSFSQLSTIFDIYEDRYDRPIQEAIERQFQGQLETECFQDMVEFIRSPSRYYSKLLQQALGKTPVDYMTLIRIIIGHEDKDLGEIKLEYSKMNDETLDETVKNHVDIAEIKRLFVLIITKGQDIMANDGGQVRFDHTDHSSSIGSGLNLTTTTSSAYATGRRLSHEAFDKFVNKFKIMRPH